MTTGRPGGRQPGPRVLYVSSHSAPGGSERVLEALLAEVPPASVAGVVALQEGPLVERLRGRGTAVDVLATGASPLAMAVSAARLRRVLHRTRPSVVHANGVKAALVAVAAARAAARRPVPVVWMKHDVSLDGPVGRWLARRCAAVAAVSREVARGLGRAGRQVVVPPGLRVDPVAAGREAAELRRRHGLDGAVLTVLGRLDPAKGHAELLEVLPELRRSLHRVTGLLVGPDDPQHPGVRDRLAARARDLGVAEHVRLPGALPSAGVIAASDVVLVPTVPRADGSGREGFGLVAAEALALGVPVVAYDVGATGEVLGGSGVLVRAGDRAALARAVTGLVTAAHEERAERARRGRERAAGLTVERTAARLLELYAEVTR